MDKSTLLLVAMVLAVFGGSVALGHPDWGTFTGLALILLAAGLAAGTLPIRARDFLEERSAPSQRVSNGLVTLSSAAIVAIYVAGYHRTSLAAHKFDLQGSQGRVSAEVANVVPPVPATNPPSNAAGAAGGSAIPTEKKNNPLPPKPGRKAPAPNSAGSAGAPAPGGAGSEAGAAGSAATANGATSAAPAAVAQSGYKDGTYSGWGSCRHGDIEASVIIQEGKIASVMISQCLTRYSCSWIAPKNPDSGLPDLPAQVVQRQNAKVDYVSGATESSYAFADAVVAALSKAMGKTTE